MMPKQPKKVRVQSGPVILGLAIAFIFAFVAIAAMLTISEMKNAPTQNGTLTFDKYAPKVRQDARLAGRWSLRSVSADGKRNDQFEEKVSVRISRYDTWDFQSSSKMAGMFAGSYKATYLDNGQVELQPVGKDDRVIVGVVLTFNSDDSISIRIKAAAHPDDREPVEPDGKLEMEFVRQDF
jgi:hypothetical protein